MARRSIRATILFMYVVVREELCGRLFPGSFGNFQVIGSASFRGFGLKSLRNGKPDFFNFHESANVILSPRRVETGAL